MKLQKLYLDKPAPKPSAAGAAGNGGVAMDGNGKVIAGGSITKRPRVIELPNAKYMNMN